jgi:hypothetical protein
MTLPRLSRSDDRAAAGVVGGIIMLGAIVAFLAYVNVAWVPAWVESKESIHASGLSDAMATWATDAEDHVSRAQTGRSWSVSFPLGVSGLPILGTGSSSGELSVIDAPRLNVTRGGVPLVVANGGVAMSTHTQRFPNQTYLYALGAMEIGQSDGAWVDLRSLLTVSRTSGGEVALAIQAVNLSGAQQVSGNGEAAIGGTLATAATNATPSDASHGGSVTIQVQNVQAGAWRAALNRTFAGAGLRGVATPQPECLGLVTTQAYCYKAGNNTATQVELVLYDVVGNWEGQVAAVTVDLRS